MYSTSFMYDCILNLWRQNITLSTSKYLNKQKTIHMSYGFKKIQSEFL